MSTENPSSAAPSEAAEESLYQIHKTIHVRAVTGWFATWRWSMVWFTQALYYGLCWLPWNGRQAVLFDLAERKFYIFGLIFWPQDLVFLAGLMIISAISLFLFTAVGGRLWCGYTCPQTVYTEIFLWIERKIEGDRMARMRLESASMGMRKLAIRGAKYGTWGAVALWTGFTFVGYFTPIKTLWAQVPTLSFGPWETFWILFYGIWTYIFAGHLREQVCKYMCPYARFQGVMFDPDTLTITYDQERGEPRGPRKKTVDYKAAGKGSCVDCSICVQVCPTGIDIRDGLQYECIGCAACIDACDQVMDKMGYAKGLIRYSTENAIAKHWGWKEIVDHIARPRVVIYATILATIVGIWGWGLATKPSLRLDVLRDRATLAREVEHGMIENVYRLQIMNVSEEPRQLTIGVGGLVGMEVEGEAEHVVDVPAASNKTLTVQVRVPPDAGKPGSNPIYFELKSLNAATVAAHEKATFLIPK
jgi:cytochrome c oxidase accessory protein FixG